MSRELAYFMLRRAAAVHTSRFMRSIELEKAASACLLNSRPDAGTGHNPFTARQVPALRVGRITLCQNPHGGSSKNEFHAKHNGSDPREVTNCLAYRELAEHVQGKHLLDRRSLGFGIAAFAATLSCCDHAQALRTQGERLEPPTGNAASNMAEVPVAYLTCERMCCTRNCFGV